MTNKNKPIDPIPNEFDSYEAAAEFWDSHDTIDYLADFADVAVEDAKLDNRIFEVELEEDIAMTLSQLAKKDGISLKSLVSQMLRQHLPPAA